MFYSDEARAGTKVGLIRVLGISLQAFMRTRLRGTRLWPLHLVFLLPIFITANSGCHQWNGLTRQIAQTTGFIATPPISDLPHKIHSEGWASEITWGQPDAAADGFIVNYGFTQE